MGFTIKIWTIAKISDDLPSKYGDVLKMDLPFIRDDGQTQVTS